MQHSIIGKKISIIGRSLVTWDHLHIMHTPTYHAHTYIIYIAILAKAAGVLDIHIQILEQWQSSIYILTIHLDPKKASGSIIKTADLYIIRPQF